MTRINTNVPSLIAQKILARSNNQLQESLLRLSTGLRINVGKDDPSGLIASEVLRSDIVATQRAITNSERANQIIGTADSALGQVSALLNDIRGLVSEAANTGAVSEDQIKANQLQVDSSLEAIDRIAQTTSFQGRRLLDGSLDFITTAITDATGVRIDQANFGTATAVTVNVEVDVQATRAQLVYGDGDLVDDVNLQVGGQDGFEVFNFGAGTTIDDIADAVNLVSDATGIEATVNGTDLEFDSVAYGSDAFVSIRALSGTFATTTTEERANGTDADVRINGVQATADGLNISLNTATLDLRFKINDTLVDNDTFTFDITGGGAIFQLGPDVVSNQQARLGIQGVSTATLDGPSGALYELKSGQDKNLSDDVKGAAKIVDEVITSVTNLRGRLGAFQRTTLETNIITLNDTMSNLVDAESSIRDADFAVESARLTRAQILVQSGTSVLAIANQNPQNVLALLR
jgi:flagellin